MICSSGIACKVYAKGVASAVHEYYRLGIGDLPSKQLIQQAASNSLVVERIRDANVMAMDANDNWDEVSICLVQEFWNLSIVCITS